MRGDVKEEEMGGEGELDGGGSTMWDYGRAVAKRKESLEWTVVIGRNIRLSSFSRT